MKIVFFGGSKYVLSVLEKLNKDHCLSLVLTSDKKDTDHVPSFCKQNNIPFLKVTGFEKHVLERIKKEKTEVAVLADFGLKIPNEVLEIFPKGILNIHPSLLPIYRGPTPGQTAILNGDKITGVTIMKVDEKIDHGPILVQKEEAINKNETADELYLRLFKIGADLLYQNIKQYIKGDLKLESQDDKKATYTKILARQDGYINLNGLKINLLKRLIRAYSPWPGVWGEIMINNKPLRIKFLPNKKLQIEGKNPIGYKDFENGYPIVYNQIRPLLK